MYNSTFKLVIVLLALVYVAAGIACVRAMDEQEHSLAWWTLFAAFWFFLAAGIWRLNRIARTVSVTLMWALVVFGTLGALHSYYFEELSGLFDFPLVRNQPEILVVPVIAALLVLRVLAKNKEEFR